MQFDFYKYQGTGNDFIIIDNRKEFFPKNNAELISRLCDRKFGIGADGLLLLENNTNVHFSMIYYNKDGNLGSMCGNGGRCIVHFANYLGIIKYKTVFKAIDGLHEATIKGEIISLKMKDISTIEVFENHVFIDTGSPHHVQMVNNLKSYNVKKEGARIRNDRYGKVGANINFIEHFEKNIFAIRTYERGVENETLSCGTGVTAVAVALFETGKIKSKEVILKTEGGLLTIWLNKTTSGYNEIFLEGPAKMVYKGKWK